MPRTKAGAAQRGRAGSRLIAARAAGLVAFAAVYLQAAPALATRGPDDSGLVMISSILALLVALVVSGVVFLPLHLWTTRSGRRRGHYWLTLLGCCAGVGAGVLLMRNLPSSVLLDDNYESPAWLLAIPVVVSALGGVACFFVWRKPPRER